MKTGNFRITRELLLHVSHVVCCLSNSVLRRQYLLRWTAYSIILLLDTAITDVDDLESHA